MGLGFRVWALGLLRGNPTTYHVKDLYKENKNTELKERSPEPQTLINL